MDFIQQKKVLYGLVALLLAGIVGLIIFRLVSPPTPFVPEEPESVTGKVGSPEPEGGTVEKPATTSPSTNVNISQEKLVRITDFSVVSPVLNASGDKIFFYKKEGGDLYASEATNGAPEKISNITILGLIDAVWSSSRDRAAIFYLDGETKKGFLHIGTSTVLALPPDIKGFAWSPDRKSLAYTTLKGNKLQLTLADSSGKKPRVVFSTPILDAEVRWVTNDRIAFQNAPTGTAEGYSYFFSISARTFRKILGPFLGLTTLWSPDGTLVLAGSTDSTGKKLTLNFHDDKGKEVFKTGLSTLPEKCVFADRREAYCAVPRSISPKTVWPDEYLRGEINTSDRLVAIDTVQKTINEVFDEENFDMSDLSVTRNKAYLFFVNRTDGILWRVKLKEAAAPLFPPLSSPLTKNLSLGSRGNDVKALQELLASDPALYPEGKITGYFGSKTRAAVIRFQEQYGIAKPGDEEYGIVGITTRTKIDELTK